MLNGEGVSFTDTMCGPHLAVPSAVWTMAECCVIPTLPSITDVSNDLLWSGEAFHAEKDRWSQYSAPTNFDLEAIENAPWL